MDIFQFLFSGAFSIQSNRLKLKYICLVMKHTESFKHRRFLIYMLCSKYTNSINCRGILGDLELTPDYPPPPSSR